MDPLNTRKPVEQLASEIPEDILRDIFILALEARYPRIRNGTGAFPIYIPGITNSTYWVLSWTCSRWRTVVHSLGDPVTVIVPVVGFPRRTIDALESFLNQLHPSTKIAAEFSFDQGEDLEDTPIVADVLSRIILPFASRYRQLMLEATPHFLVPFLQLPSGLFQSLATLTLKNQNPSSFQWNETTAVWDYVAAKNTPTLEAGTALVEAKQLVSLRMDGWIGFPEDPRHLNLRWRQLETLAVVINRYNQAMWTSVLGECQGLLMLVVTYQGEPRVPAGAPPLGQPAQITPFMLPLLTRFELVRGTPDAVKKLLASMTVPSLTHFTLDNVWDPASGAAGVSWPHREWNDLVIRSGLGSQLEYFKTNVKLGSDDVDSLLDLLPGVDTFLVCRGSPPGKNTVDRVVKGRVGRKLTSVTFEVEDGDQADEFFRMVEKRVGKGGEEGVSRWKQLKLEYVYSPTQEEEQKREWWQRELLKEDVELDWSDDEDMGFGLFD